MAYQQNVGLANPVFRGVGSHGLQFVPNLLQQETATNQLNEQARQFDVRAGLYKDWMAQYNQGGQGFNALLNSYNQAYAQASAANEAKYQQQLGLVNQVSGQQRADTIAQFQKQQADQLQQLQRTGLANTTIGSSIKTGIAREQSGALNRLADTMLGTKLGVMQGYNYQGMDPGVTSTALSAMAPKQMSFQF